MLLNLTKWPISINIYENNLHYKLILLENIFSQADS